MEGQECNKEDQVELLVVVSSKKHDNIYLNPRLHAAV